MNFQELYSNKTIEILTDQSTSKINQIFVLLGQAELIDKTNLLENITDVETFHLNGNYLDKFRTDGLERIENINIFEPPNGFAMHLSHTDLNLSYFKFIQKRVTALTSGDSIAISKEGCKNEKGELVLKFSKKFRDRLVTIRDSGFELKDAKVNFIVHWKAEDKVQEVKIVLPELYFERILNN